MVPVILGILIALFINNWKENRANERYVERALTTISMEINENLSSITDVLPRHYALMEEVMTHLENDTLGILEIVGRAGGVQSPTIKSAAWKFFLNSKSELIDYEVASALVEMDEAKRVMDVKLEQFLSYSYEKMNATSSVDKQQFLIYFSNIVDSEETLQELYQTYLVKHTGVTFSTEEGEAPAK